MHRRKGLRFPSYCYSSNGAYFVTICAANRRCIFSRSLDDGIELLPTGSVVSGSWAAIPDHHPGWAVDAFVVMPNHLHGVLRYEDVGAGYIRPLQIVVGTFKAAVSRHVGRNVWQRGYHDRIIRSDRELAAFREYIETNPLRWALDRENPNRR